MVISGYYIGGYWCLLMAIILMAIGGYYGYFINGYQWLLCCKLLLINICYIMTIGDYYVVGYF